MTNGNDTINLAQGRVAQRLLGLSRTSFQRWAEGLPPHRVSRGALPPKIALAVYIIQILEKEKKQDRAYVRPVAEELFEICERTSYSELAQQSVFYNFAAPDFRVGPKDEFIDPGNEAQIVLGDVLRRFFELRDGDASLFEADNRDRITALESARRA